MRKRFKMSRRHSRRKFIKGAVRSHKFNRTGSSRAMRGGIRM